MRRALIGTLAPALSRVALSSTLLLSSPSLAVAAQELLPVRPGDRVRLAAPGLVTGTSVGTVLALQADTLLLEHDEDEGLVTIPIASVTGLEVSRGQRSRWARGLGVGFLAGAVVGAVYGATNAGTASGEIDLPTEVAIGVGAAVFGAGGALLGVVVGALIKTDDWEQVPLEGLTVAILPPVAGRAGLRLSRALR